MQHNIKHHSITRSFGIAAIAGALLLTACSGDDIAKDAAKKAGVELSTGGDLPDGFPKDVPTPGLKLETGAGTAGTYALRYTSKDAKADADAYKKQLTDAGFTVSGEANDLGQGGDHIAFFAEKAGTTVGVSAFGPNAPGGGNYLAVSVTPKL